MLAIGFFLIMHPSNPANDSRGLSAKLPQVPAVPPLPTVQPDYLYRLPYI